MNLILSGLTGSGKTTIARLLATQLGLRYISGSAVRLKHVGSNVGAMAPEFWRLSQDAVQLDHDRMQWPGADLAADSELARLCQEEDGAVFDAWILPWLVTRGAISVWLECALAIRATRISISSPVCITSTQPMIETVAAKDGRARAFFQKYYEVDIFTDRRPFSLILDTGATCGYGDSDSGDASIVAVLEILQAVVLFYSTSPKRGGELFRQSLVKHPPAVFVRYPVELCKCFAEQLEVEPRE